MKDTIRQTEWPGEVQVDRREEFVVGPGGRSRMRGPLGYERFYVIGDKNVRSEKGRAIILSNNTVNTHMKSE